MVVLEHEHLCKVDAVVEAAANEHGVFLDMPQAGEGLARVEKARMGSLKGRHIVVRQVGYA